MILYTLALFEASFDQDYIRNIYLGNSQFPVVIK